MKILITNSHADNRGDEAAQRSLINSLRALVPDTIFTVLTVSPNGLHLQDDVNVITTFSAPRQNKYTLFIILWTVLKSLGIQLPTFNKLPLTFKALEKMANADIIISAPGGPYFGDLYSSHEIREHLFHILLSKILRKPVMIYGPSMGPFRSRRRNIIRRYLLNKVEIISLRDKISHEYLESLKLTHPLVYLTADSAFQSSFDSNKQQIEELMIAEYIIHNQKDLDNKLLVGITPTGAAWNYRGSTNPVKEQERYNKIIAKSIDYLIDSFNATIVFFPQLYGNSDDRPLIYDIINHIVRKDAVRVLSNKWDSDIQQAVISKMDFVIGNRYHSVIFALNEEIPIICIAYEHKSVGIMMAAKLEEYVININDLSYEILTSKINDVLNQSKEIKELLKYQMPAIRKLSLMNSILAMALIKCTLRNSVKRKELMIEIEKLVSNLTT